MASDAGTCAADLGLSSPDATGLSIFHYDPASELGNRLKKKKKEIASESFYLTIF